MATVSPYTSVPSNKVAGNPIKASEWNQLATNQDTIKTTVESMSARAVHAYGSWTQSLTVGGTVVLGSEHFDEGSAYNVSTGEYTAPVAGIYSVSASGSITVSGGSGNRGSVVVAVNGTAVRDMSAVVDAVAVPVPVAFDRTCLLSLDASDVVTLRIAQTGNNAPTSFTVDGGDLDSAWLTVCLAGIA